MPHPKANLLVAFYSRDGAREALAKAVGEGAREAGAEAQLGRVPDIVSPSVMAHVPLGGAQQKDDRRVRSPNASRSESAEKDGGRTLIATSRPSRGSFARYTSPIPPAPIGARIS